MALRHTLDLLPTWIDKLDDRMEVAMAVGVVETKQKLAELVERASREEEIVRTCRGRERARLVGAAARSRCNLKEIFESFARVRM